MHHVWKKVTNIKFYIRVLISPLLCRVCSVYWLALRLVLCGVASVTAVPPSYVCSMRSYSSTSVNLVFR